MKYQIELKESLQGDAEYRYMLLGRHIADCAYFLSSGNALRLWGGGVKDHIQNMKDLYNSFPDATKPKWISYKKILQYEWKLTAYSLEVQQCS